MVSAAEFLKWLLVFGVHTGGGGGGTVTSITAGSGLTGGTITGSGTIALAIPVVSADGGTGLTTFAASSLLYASSANTWGALGTLDNSILTAGASGVPVFSTTLPSGLTIPGYLALTGGTMSGAISMGGFAINNLLDPVASSDAATKNYVDTVAAGLAPAGAVNAATTVNFPSTYNNGSSGVGATLTATSTGAVSFDGVAVTLTGDYLFKNQTDQTQNGIYSCSTLGAVGVAAVFVRNIHYDTPESINNTGIVPVINGSTQAGQGYYETATVVAIGTTPLIYINFGNSGTVTSITAGTGLTGGTITGTGTVALSIPVLVTSGGTGLTSTTANAILYSSSTSVIGQIAVVNSAVLSTGAGGVPVLSTTLPSGLTIPGYVAAGANSSLTNLTGLTGVIQAPTQINDVNANPIITFSHVASAVNYFTFSNKATGGFPTLMATGSDATVGLSFQNKGGLFQFIATGVPTTIGFFDSAGSNYVGFAAPATLAGNTVWTLPSTDSAGFLTSNGAGVLSIVAGGTVTSVSGAGLATGTVTSSGNITVTAAVKTDQTTATSTSVAVVPGVQQYHPSAVKAWTYTTSPASSPPTLSASYNISSVARNSTGNYTYNFTTSFTSSSYSTVLAQQDAGAGGFIGFGTIAAGSIVCETFNTATSPIAADLVHSFHSLGTQ